MLLVGETGCGKTTVCQLYSILYQRHLHVVNCHANSETSDLLGGLRPLRGRDAKVFSMVDSVRELLTLASPWVPSSNLTTPAVLLEDRDEESKEGEAKATTLDGFDRNQLNSIESSVIAFARSLHSHLKSLYDAEAPLASSAADEKKRKRRPTDPPPPIDSTTATTINETMMQIEKKYNLANALFEWLDGPLVTAMRSGHLILLDEMSLAEDAVLERLNSVLEPGRTLTLAEKGSSAEDDEIDEVRIDGN